MLAANVCRAKVSDPASIFIRKKTERGMVIFRLCYEDSGRVLTQISNSKFKYTAQAKAAAEVLKSLHDAGASLLDLQEVKATGCLWGSKTGKSTRTE